MNYKETIPEGEGIKTIKDEVIGNFLDQLFKNFKPHDWVEIIEIIRCETNKNLVDKIQFLEKECAELRQCSEYLNKGK